MGNALANCTKILALDPADTDYMSNSSGRYKQQAEAAAPPQPAGPQLALRIAYAPIEDSLGAKPSPFTAGDEVAITQLEKVKGWECLGWRQERSAKQHAQSDHSGGVQWPRGARFSAAQRFYGAKVVASDGNGGFEEHWCMLQVAISPKDRDMQNVKAGVEDAKDTASYAHRFNMQTARTCDQEDEPEAVPGIKVCAPVGCFVLGSAVSEIVQPGEAVSLVAYPSPTVKKFVFEGGDDFLELPQAFFHYVSWLSGGREFVGDIQGYQDDHDILIMDPVLLRAPKPTIGDIIGVVASAATGSENTETEDKSEQRFNVWHPRCGQLCKGFDPQRRSMKDRKACGMSLPSCGVGGA